MSSSTITLQTDVSVSMTAHGIDLYQDDSDIPIAIYSFDDLLKDFVETYELFFSDKEKEIVISNLEKMIATIKEKL
jgi:hypothetical protein